MRFSGKVAIITGAGQGIGAAYARALAQEGASIVIAEIDRINGQQAAEEICQSGYAAIFIETDIASETSCAAMAKGAVDTFGGIDFLINNASIFSGKRKEGLLTIDYDYYLRFMEVNMHGQLLVARAVYGEMSKRGGGVIINQSSSAAWSAGDFYSVSKAATNAITVSLAREMGPLNIRVNAIAPGPIDTPATRGTVSAERIKEICDSLPLARLGSLDDVVNLCLFLLSAEASWITGQIIGVDGGSVVRL